MPGVRRLPRILIYAVLIALSLFYLIPVYVMMA